MTQWADLNARARGLSTHLLGRAALERLAASADLAALAEELGRRGYLIEPTGRTSPESIELAARRYAAGRFRTLRRWAGPRTPALAIVFEDEDRRSISAMLRGAVQKAAPDRRLSGLIPTPALPERALEQLSRQPAPAGVTALLAAWRHPLAPSLQLEAAKPEIDLFRLEVSLSRSFFERARTASRGHGRETVLFDYVRRLIDLQNTLAILSLSVEKSPNLEEIWIAGGKVLSLAAGQHAVQTGSPGAAAPELAAAFGAGSLARALAEQCANPITLETGILSALIAELKATARTAPLSPAPLLEYTLRLRAELLDLRRTVWGIPLGAPPRMLAEGMATPP